MPEPSDLGGVSGLGPVRRTLLTTAGVTTRIALAALTVEQLVSITGMPRSQAERTLAALATVPEPPPPAQEPEEIIAPPPPRPTSDFDRALDDARTALSDASRLLPASAKLAKPLYKTALLLDALAKRSETLGTKRRTRLASLLSGLTVRLERAAVRAGDSTFTLERAQRLRRRLKATRQTLVRELRG